MVLSPQHGPAGISADVEAGIFRQDFDAYDPASNFVFLDVSEEDVMWLIDRTHYGQWRKRQRGLP
jgi:hypothetical protein